jgi:hypothetical protein
VPELLSDSIAGRANFRRPRDAFHASASQAAAVATLAAFVVGASRALAYGIALQPVGVTTAIALGLRALFAEGLRTRTCGQADEQPYLANRKSRTGKSSWKRQTVGDP